MTIASPTLFAFRHDWGAPFKVTRELRTDVQQANDGSEIRVQLRATPTVSMTMRALFLTEYGAGRLLAQWRGATQPLRYYAPLWCDATDLDTDLAGGESSIACDTTDRPFFVDSGFAMLYSENRNGVVTSELVTIDTLASTTGFSITGTVTNAYTAGPSTRVVPCRIMWLQLPVDVTWLSNRLAQADLTFVEEVDQAAYALSDTSAAQVAASVVIYYDNESRYGLNSVGMGIKFLEAMPFDADGLPLPNQPVTWSVTDLEGNTPPQITIVPSMNSRFAYLTTTTPSSTVTATCGSVSTTTGAS